MMRKTFVWRTPVMIEHLCYLIAWIYVAIIEIIYNTSNILFIIVFNIVF